MSTTALSKVTYNLNRIVPFVHSRSRSNTRSWWPPNNRCSERYMRTVTRMYPEDIVAIWIMNNKINFVGTDDFAYAQAANWPAQVFLSVLAQSSLGLGEFDVQQLLAMPASVMT